MILVQVDALCWNLTLREENVRIKYRKYRVMKLHFFLDDIYIASSSWYSMQFIICGFKQGLQKKFRTIRYGKMKLIFSPKGGYWWNFYWLTEIIFLEDVMFDMSIYVFHTCLSTCDACSLMRLMCFFSESFSLTSEERLFHWSAKLLPYDISTDTVCINT